MVNSIFIIIIAKMSLALLTHTIVDLIHPNSAIDSKKLQFAVDLFSLVRPNSPMASAVEPSFFDMSQLSNRIL